MKTNILNLSAVAYLSFFVLFTGTLFAQSASNLTGIFEGTRSQFDATHQKIAKEFTYKYELTQRENIVEGISTIIGEDGNYAEVGIRGIVIKNKFYFEEFKMLDQINSENMQWCYKSGVLNISEKGNQVYLTGETPSYMVNYGFACSGGITKLSATKLEKEENVDNKSMSVESNFEIDIYPNPTSDFAKVKFYAEKDSKIKIEIFDLTGKAAMVAIEKNIAKGEFRQSIDVSKFANGMYIFKATLNDEVHTHEFVKY